MELKLEHISKEYKNTTALDDFSMTFSEGIYGLLGPNGAGKTTLLNIVATVLAASEGEIFYDEKNIYDDLEQYRSKIGYLPQKVGFYDHFTGYDLMKYMCHLKGGDDKNTKQMDE